MGAGAMVSMIASNQQNYYPPPLATWPPVQIPKGWDLIRAKFPQIARKNMLADAFFARTGLFWQIQSIIFESLTITDLRNLHRALVRQPKAKHFFCQDIEYSPLNVLKPLVKYVMEYRTELSHVKCPICEENYVRVTKQNETLYCRICCSVFQRGCPQHLGALYYRDTYHVSIITAYVDLRTSTFINRTPLLTHGKHSLPTNIIPLWRCTCDIISTNAVCKRKPQRICAFNATAAEHIKTQLRYCLIKRFLNLHSQ